MNKSEIWQKIKNDSSKVYNEPIFNVFLKTTDMIQKDHYVTLTLDQKKSLKPILRLKMAASVFNKEESEIIDGAFKDAGDGIEVKAAALRMIRDAANHGNLDLIDYFLTNPKVRSHFVNKIELTNDQVQKIGLERIINNALASAIGENKINIVKHLVEKDYLNYLDDINILDMFASSIRKGWIEIVQYLFDEVITKRNQVDERSLKEKAIEYPEIHKSIKTAANFNHLDVVRFLFKNGFYSEKALPEIAKEGDLELTQNIVERMDAKKPESQGFLNDAFRMAALHNHVDVLKYLYSVIKQSMRPYWVGYKSALNAAAMNGNIDAIKYIIDNLPIEFEDLKNTLSYNDLRNPNAKEIAKYLNEKLEKAR